MARRVAGWGTWRVGWGDGGRPHCCLPAEVRVPGLQLRGDLPAHLRRAGGLRPRLRLPGRRALGLEEQRRQLQCVLPDGAGRWEPRVRRRWAAVTGPGQARPSHPDARLPQPSPARATRPTATTAGPAAAPASRCPTAPPSATPAPCPWKAATAPRAPTSTTGPSACARPSAPVSWTTTSSSWLASPRWSRVSSGA